MNELELADGKIPRIDICHTERTSIHYLVQGVENEDIFECMIPEILQVLCWNSPECGKFDIMIRLIPESEGSAKMDLDKYFQTGQWNTLDPDNTMSETGIGAEEISGS